MRFVGEAILNGLADPLDVADLDSSTGDHRAARQQMNVRIRNDGALFKRNRAGRFAWQRPSQRTLCSVLFECYRSPGESNRTPGPSPADLG